MAIYLSKKRIGAKKHWGRKAAEDVSTTRTCPNCGEQADPYEIQKDRITYKCKKCRSVNTYTQMPGGDISNKKPKKSKKLGAVTLRDRSKGEDKKVVATRSKQKEDDIDEEEFEKNIKSIQESMKDKKVLAFKYVDSKGNETARNVEPYKLTADKKGDIILYGFCLEGNGIRTFKLKRTADCSKTEYDFKPQFPIENTINDD